MQMHITMPECAHCKAEIGLKIFACIWGIGKRYAKTSMRTAKERGAKKAEEMGDVVVFVWLLK